MWIRISIRLLLALLTLLPAMVPLAKAEQAPTIIRLDANITNAVALLSSEINPKALPTAVWFLWGTVGGMGHTNQPIDVGGGTSPISMTLSLPGLTTGAPYYCQILASNSAGTVASARKIFQSPKVILAGTTVVSNECHKAFSDPGVSVMSAAQAIGGGYGYSMALNYDGTVAAWGSPGDDEAVVPAGLNHVTGIAAGQFHCLAVKDNGTVVGWGDGIFGDTSPPANLTNAASAAAGLHFSLALSTNGTVVGWGDNTYGQTNIPSGLNNVVAIAAGESHALALKADGTVVGWGDNSAGKISIPEGLSNVVAIAANSTRSLALRRDGTVVQWGGDTGGAVTIPAGLSNVVAIAAGFYHSLALRSDGTVVGWGSDFYGEISLLSGLTNVTMIAGGLFHSLAVTSDGHLIAAGWNMYGQANIPANFGGNVTVSGSVDANTPGVSILNYMASNSLGGVGTATRTVIVADTTPPTIVLLGDNPLSIPVNTSFTDPGATAVDACAGNLTSNIVASGTVNTTVLGTNILIYSVTDGSGNTSLTNRVVITVAGAPFASTLSGGNAASAMRFFANVTPNGASTTVWFEWGTNILHGNLTMPFAVGDGVTNLSIFTSVPGLVAGQICHFRVVASNSVGCSYGRDVVFQEPSTAVLAPAIMLNGSAAFTNAYGSEFADPGAVVIAPIKAIAAGSYYSLALKIDGTVVAWGNAPDVPLGLAGVDAIAGGYVHCLAIKTDGTLVGWGGNSFGETNPPAGVSNVVSVAAGWGYSLALTGDGSLIGWGLNNFSPAPIPAGLNHVTGIAAGFDLCLAVQENGKVVGWGHPSFGGTMPPADLTNAVAVAAGESYGLALKSDGTVAGWGQTSIPEGLSNVVAIAAGLDHSLALRNDGTVVGWGDDYYGEATPPTDLSHVVAIAAGAYHSLALKSDGTVIGWGLDGYGETDVTTSGTNLVTWLPGIGAVNVNQPGSYSLTYTATNAGGVTSVNRTVTVSLPPPPRLQLATSDDGQPGTNAMLTVQSLAPGHIETSTNLINWTPLMSFSGTNTLSIPFAPTGTQFGARFYRGVIP